jgi:C1A family cysteine protease
LLLEQSRPAAFLWLGDRLAQPAPETAEHYALPITPPLDQGDSGLCWVFAALSMLETNYLARHPGSDIELSRAALQLVSIEDRFARRIRGEPGKLEDGGLAVEALDLIRRRGVVARNDFHDVVDSDPIFSLIEEKLARADSAEDKVKVLDSELK